MGAPRGRAGSIVRGVVSTCSGDSQEENVRRALRELDEELEVSKTINTVELLCDGLEDVRERAGIVRGGGVDMLLIWHGADS